MSRGEGSNREARELDGQLLPALKIHESDKRRILAKIFGAEELGYVSRARTSAHRTYPGIKIIDLVDVLPLPTEDTPLTQQSADRELPHQRFLLSMSKNGLIVVTSRMGYDEFGEVNVPASAGKVRRQFDSPVVMYDFEKTVSDRYLAQRHLGRLSICAVSRDVDLPQELADAAFRHIVERAPKRR